MAHTKGRSRKEAESAATTRKVRRLLIATADRIRGAGLAAMLATEGARDILGPVADTNAAMTQLEGGSVDVVVADADLPRHDGITVIDAFRRADPSVAIILLTGTTMPSIVTGYLEQGVRGLLRRDSAAEVLRLAVDQAAGDGVVVDPLLTPLLIERAGGCCTGAGGPLDLSKRQADVLALLPKGLTNREIGERLGLGEETVKTHLKLAMRKLKVSSRGEAAMVAVREGLRE